MDAQKLKARRSERRKFRVRKAIRGTAAKPRLSVFRSNKQILAQLIDDENQVTLVAAASNGKGVELKYGGNVAAAASDALSRPSSAAMNCSSVRPAASRPRARAAPRRPGRARPPRSNASRSCAG